MNSKNVYYPTQGQQFGISCFPNCIHGEYPRDKTQALGVYITALVGAIYHKDFSRQHHVVNFLPIILLAGCLRTPVHSPLTALYDTLSCTV